MLHLGIYSYVEFLYKVYLKESSDHCRSTSFEGPEEQGRVKKLKLQQLKDQPSRDTRNLPMQEQFRSSQARHGKLLPMWLTQGGHCLGVLLTFR